MSRFSDGKNISKYLDEIWNLIDPLICDDAKTKFVDSCGFVHCSSRLIEEKVRRNPFDPLLIENVRKFHDEFGGCSSKSFLEFFVLFSREIVPLAEETSLKIFSSLFDLIEKIQRFPLSEKVDRNSLNSEFFLRVARRKQIFGEMFEKIFRESKEKNPFEKIFYTTKIRNGAESFSLVDGILAERKNEETIVAGSFRSVLIDADLTEDFSHRGFNEKFEIKTKTRDRTWIELVESIVERFRVEIIFSSGRIDQRITKVRSLQHFPSKILRSLDENRILQYLTDLHDENQILQVEIRKFQENNEFIILNSSHKTVLHFIPISSVAEMKNDEFKHCLARFRLIFQHNRFVTGSTDFERKVRHFISSLETSNLEQQIAIDIFRRVLTNFIERVHSKTETFYPDLIDDPISKVEAWKRVLLLIKQLLQIDYFIQLVHDDELSDI